MIASFGTEVFRPLAPKALGNCRSHARSFHRFGTNDRVKAKFSAFCHFLQGAPVHGRLTSGDARRTLKRLSSAQLCGKGAEQLQGPHPTAHAPLGRTRHAAGGGGETQALHAGLEGVLWYGKNTQSLAQAGRVAAPPT